MAAETFVMMYPAWVNDDVPDEDRKGLKALWLIGTVMVIGNLASGIGAAFMGVVEGEYLTLCATENTKGFYFGYYWFFTNFCGIVGDYGGGYIITKVKGLTFYIIMSSAAMLGAVGFFLLPRPRLVQFEEAKVKALLNSNATEEVILT